MEHITTRDRIMIRSPYKWMKNSRKLIIRDPKTVNVINLLRERPGKCCM